MRELTVQIERLEPLRVAVMTVTSASPEDEATNALLDWARPQGLLDGPFRFFGYDNCQPHPNHTYTTWLSVGKDTKPSAKVEIKDFPGGLFAVTEIQGVEQISPAWHQMAHWLENSEYHYGDQPGLEEPLDLLADRPLSEQRFKLYLSITK
ncbi:MAG: GyrI-like domain-containing protein [Anaerolineae bacterium]|nr:GyrI-like domain-containing protein [Anaerolineae bacterium]